MKILSSAMGRSLILWNWQELYRLRYVVSSRFSTIAEENFTERQLYRRDELLSRTSIVVTNCLAVRLTGVGDPLENDCGLQWRVIASLLRTVPPDEHN